MEKRRQRKLLEEFGAPATNLVHIAAAGQDEKKGPPPVVLLNGRGSGPASFAKPSTPAATNRAQCGGSTRMAGLGRAAFWRQLGFPNCALATAARMEKRRQRKLLEEFGALQQTSSTLQPPDRMKRKDRLL
jgi:hypothetical protein